MTKEKKETVEYYVGVKTDHMDLALRIDAYAPNGLEVSQAEATRFKEREVERAVGIMKMLSMLAGYTGSGRTYTLYKETTTVEAVETDQEGKIKKTVEEVLTHASNTEDTSEQR